MEHILYWHKTGPLIKYKDGMLIIEDLNPQTKIQFEMSRLDMLELSDRIRLSV